MPGLSQPFAWAALTPDLDGSVLRDFNLEEDCQVMFDRAQHTIANVDPEVFAAIQAENQRQEDHIELIASENYTSPAVMEAQGSQLTNKYAEGYPGQALLRWLRARGRGRAAGHRPPQGTCSAPSTPTCSPTPARRPTRPCSWPSAKPGDTIMGMSLAEGGHLTHGMPLNMSGKWFNVVVLRPERHGRHRLRQDGSPGP